jgi:hypothetical protein
MLRTIMDIGLLFNLDPSVITDFMDSLLAMIFNVSQEPELNEWGNKVISGMAERTENQVTDQLGYDPRD